MWIDTHCHWDAAEFGEAEQAAASRLAAREQGVTCCVVPAVETANFQAVRAWAHQHDDVYALGIHPLFAQDAGPADLDRLDDALSRWRDDPRLVAVGEIGLDGFVPALQTPTAQTHGEWLYRAQLKLARKHGLPVILHVRKSADRLLKHLREVGVSGGIAHAFNGSQVQADGFLALNFCLGFGGTVTFETARRIRALAEAVPIDGFVLETDAPDIPPTWLYVTAERRAAGEVPPPNSPAELPRIAAVFAGLRAMSIEALALQNTANAARVLPRLGRYLSLRQ
jgi:TatD DNase family protein